MPELKIRPELWKDLQAAADRQGDSPHVLALKILRDFVKQLAENEFIAASQRAARRSKLRIAETEQAIRRHRARK
jgi:hypothetical protein